MKRKILTVIFIIIFALSLPGVCLAEKLGAEDIHLLLNGNYLESTDEPCIIEGRVMVPFADSLYLHKPMGFEFRLTFFFNSLFLCRDGYTAK